MNRIPGLGFVRTMLKQMEMEEYHIHAHLGETARRCSMVQYGS